MIGLLKRIFFGPRVDYRELVTAGAIIVDVRSVNEYKAGHLPGSKNFPLDSLQGRLKELTKINKPVITVCRSGARSGMAIGILKNAGIEAYNGGSWNSLKNKIA